MIVIDAPEVRAYIERRLGIEITEPHRALGFMSDDKRPLCAISFSEFNGSNIELTIVSEPGGLTRGVLRYVAQYAFGKLKCRRITVRTKRRNHHARAMAKRFGFKFEFPVNRYFADDDAIMFRMFPEDCRFLR